MRTRRKKASTPAASGAFGASGYGRHDSGDFIREINALPAKLLLDFPLPVSLWLEIPGAPVPVCFTTADPASEPGPVLGERIIFDRGELAALIIGAEADRVWRRELLGACFEKWRRPALRIGCADMLAGAMPDAAEPAWTVERLLRRLGAELRCVELAGEPKEPKEPKEPQRYPAAA